nr:uncharacterized protein LOC129152387 [Nothobranchius furzeri]
MKCTVGMMLSLISYVGVFTNILIVSFKILNCAMILAGFLGAACTWILILTQDLAAGSVFTKHADGASCSLKELTALTENDVEDSLELFDEANGRTLGTWFPGFPELQVHQNAPLSGSKIQCDLHFMAQGLQKVLEDQEHNLNPADVSLHKRLRHTISRVSMLAACVTKTLGGKCSHYPTPPRMPRHAFERKQWSHTLLKSAKGFLAWMLHQLEEQTRNANKQKLKNTKASLHRYLVGSGNQL